LAAFAIEFKPIERQFLVDQYTPEISAFAGQIADDFDLLFDLTGTLIQTQPIRD
jgi:hypothetical protein